MNVKLLSGVVAGTLLGFCLGLSLTGPGQGTSHAAQEPDLDPGEDCDQPAYLLVLVEDFDPAASADYAAALRETGIVAAHGGAYVAVGKPTRLLEGEWPEDRAFVLERYPCLEALNAMWDSPRYQQDIKPLREGSGHYTVAAFRSVGDG